jgi:hypothetical protein
MSDIPTVPIPHTLPGAPAQPPSQDETIAFASTAIPARAPSTFHRFGDLPQEIRHMIWEEAMPGPRIVRAKLRHFKGGLCSRVCKYYRTSFDVADSKSF